MDKLSVVGIDMWVRVGCTAEERAFPQNLKVDVGLELPLSGAGQSDKLEDTIDYADMVKRVKRFLENKTYQLIEAVAEDAARSILSDKKIKVATIHISKRALPGIERAEIEIRRARK